MKKTKIATALIASVTWLSCAYAHHGGTHDGVHTALTADLLSDRYEGRLGQGLPSGALSEDVDRAETKGADRARLSHPSSAEAEAALRESLSRIEKLLNQEGITLF